MRKPDSIHKYYNPNSDYLVRYIEKKISWNNQTLAVYTVSTTYTGYNPIGIVGVYNPGEVAVEIESFSIDNNTKNATVLIRRYNNTAYTGTIGILICVLYTQTNVTFQTVPA